MFNSPSLYWVWLLSSSSCVMVSVDDEDYALPILSSSTSSSSTRMLPSWGMALTPPSKVSPTRLSLAPLGCKKYFTIPPFWSLSLLASHVNYNLIEFNSLSVNFPLNHLRLCSINLFENSWVAGKTTCCFLQIANFLIIFSCKWHHRHLKSRTICFLCWFLQSLDGVI